MWKFLKSLGVGKAQQTFSGILDLNALNEHFGTSPVVMDPSVKQQTLSLLAATPRPDCPIFEICNISPQQILVYLKVIKTKAVGEDCLGLDMLVLVAEHIAPVLSKIINFSFASGTFPLMWKLAHVIPLPKTSNPTSFSQYRPISILPILSKVIEHFVNHRLSSHLNRHNLFNPLQSGFRPGHSTVTALVKVTDDIRHNIQNKMLTILVLLDFSSAFNTVDFDILIGIFQNLNFSPNAILWFHAYLFGRRQRVKADDHFSEWHELGAGVPQGGVLSPLLFSIFIDGITKSLHSSYHLYADDLQIYAAARFDDLPALFEQINTDLDSISSWAERFGLKVNAAKSQAIIIGSSHFVGRLSESEVVLPDLKFDGAPIAFSDTVKNLGIIMDQTLSWTAHVTEVSRRLFASLHSLRRLQNFFPFQTKLTLSRSLLLPLLDYGDIAFLDLSEELLDKLERMQNVCIRYIYGLRKYDHVSHFRERLGWLPIRRRRDMHTLCLLYNVLFNPTSPSYLFERFSYLATGSKHRLRSSSNLTLAFPPNKARSYAKSFTFNSVKLWNGLPLSLKESRSVGAFRDGLRKLWLSTDVIL